METSEKEKENWVQKIDVFAFHFNICFPTHMHRRKTGNPCTNISANMLAVVISGGVILK